MTKSLLFKTLAFVSAAVLAFACTKPKETELSLSTLAANFDASGSPAITVNVSSNTNWTVSCAADWVSISPKSGSDNGSFQISVTANETFSVRNADVTVTAAEKVQTVKVSQLASTPSLDASPVRFEVSHEGATCEVSVNSNTSWTVILPEFPADAAWIISDKTEGEGSATVTLTVLKNQDREAREATVVIRENVGSSTKEIAIVQEMGPLSHYTDSLALVSIYNLADGANWKESRRWALDTPIDTWPGIKLNEEGRVIELSITNGTVTTVEWELPEVLTDLDELKVFQAVGSKVKGTIPDFLYGMTKLTKVRLNTNNLTGELSDKLGQLTELTELYLNGNKQLGGSLPATIGQLKKLESINIAQTSVGGAIPAELVGCTALVNFMAYECKFSGEVPDFWDQFANVGIIQLYNNPGLEGPLPASCGRATTTAKNYSLRFDGCNFTGNIPATYANLPSVCKQFWTKGNKLSGVVPAGVQAHANWSAWKPAENILPQQEGYVLTLKPEPSRQLDSLALVAFYEAAHGAEWDDAKKWDLNQPMDTWTGITLKNNRVDRVNFTAATMPTEWTLPEEIGDLTELTWLKINGNKLTGQIPESLYGLEKLATFYLQNNALTGSLSEKLGQLTALTDFYIDRNPNLTGSLPASIGQLKNLKNINIAKTGISGSIPAELVGCTALVNFMAYECKFSGEVPDFWDQFANVGIIQLYNNPGLVGPLPASCGRATTTAKNYSLRFDGCNFTGNIPESYANLPSVCKQFWTKGNKLSGVVPAGVQAHANWSAWKPADNILPQQEGYGLTTE